MSGNAPSNNEEAISSQTSQEESGAIVLQNKGDLVVIQQMFRLLNAYSSQQTEDQRPQGPSEDDLRYMIHDLNLLEDDVTSRIK